MRFIFWLIIAILLINCGDLTKRGSLKPLGKIVLIFNNIPENHRYEFPTGITTNNGGFEIYYINDDGLPQFLIPNKKKSDTVVITTKRDIIEIEHAYRGADKLSFFFQNGDTINFRYEEKMPFASINNGSEGDGVNFDPIVRKSVQHGDFPASIKYSSPFAFQEFPKISYEVENLKAMENFKLIAHAEHAAEKKLLDSLTLKKEISAARSKLLKLKNKYDSLSFAHQTNTIKILPSKYLDNDSLLFFPFYNHFLDVLLRNYYSRGAPTIKIGNAFAPNYETVYDSIKTNGKITVATKSVLLRMALQEIIFSGDVRSIRKYSSDFISTTKDSVSLKFLFKENRIDLPF